MKQLKKKTVEIPQVIYTDQFLRFVAVYANRFKATNGYGRWLAEYRRMDEHGWFKPEKLRELYIDIVAYIKRYKRLVLDNKIPFPISTWEHSYRYKGYGYNLCRESKKKLLDAIRNTTPKDDELLMYNIGGWD